MDKLATIRVFPQGLSLRSPVPAARTAVDMPLTLGGAQWVGPPLRCSCQSLASSSHSEESGQAATVVPGTLQVPSSEGADSVPVIETFLQGVFAT